MQKIISCGIHFSTLMYSVCYRLSMNLEIPGASSQSIATSAASTEQDELSQRLARLRET